MASQVDNGKAFEWAVGVALAENGLTLSQSSASDKNEFCFNTVSPKKQSLFIKNARLAISHIFGIM